MMTPLLHTELWTSWAAVLRSYCSLHGLGSPQHAVVEVSAQEITVRAGSRWLRFTPAAMQHSDHPPTLFALTEQGDVLLDQQPAEPMDLAAERLARQLLQGESEPLR